MKKIPLRMCIVSREKCEKKDLFRIVRMPDGNVIYDKSGKQNGKGAYLKKDKEVILKAQKSKVLDHALEVSVPDVLYDELLGEING